MSVVFTPHKIGGLEIKNRFVHSATYESMAAETGRVTDDLIKRYRKLARGDIGLITPGHLYIHPRGRAHRFQTGIHRFYIDEPTLCQGTRPGKAIQRRQI